MKPFPPPTPAHFRQRGSITVSAAFAVLIGLLMLISAQIGYLFYMKRELQKVADLAALSAVQVLAPTSMAVDCMPGSAVDVAARESAAMNAQGLFEAISPEDIEVECRFWDPTRPPNPAGDSYKHLFPNDEEPPYRVNAVRVSIEKTLGALIPSVVGDWAETKASVVAVASSTAPVASFSVGSRLLSISDGLLGAILSSAGVDIAGTKILDSNGLATLRVTPAGLLQALPVPIEPAVIANIGTPEELISVGQVKLSDLLDASLTAVKRSTGVADARVGLLAGAVDVLLNAARLNLSGTVPLFGDNGILATANIGDIQSALNADIGVTDLVKTALMVSNGKSAVDLNLSLLGGLGAADGKLTGVRVKIVEPPTLAWGGEGTMARNTGIKIYLDLKVPLVGGLLNLLGIPLLDQTIVLETSKSVATLDKICRSPLAGTQALLSASWSLTRACRVSGAADTCGVSGLTETMHDIRLTEPPSPDFAQLVRTNDIGVAVLVDDVVNVLLDSLGPALGGLGKLLLAPVLALLKPLLHGIVEPLLTAVLNVLGINLGETDVSLLSVDCGKPRLVY